MPGLGPRIRREMDTVEAMIRIHCMGKHGGHQVPCRRCRELLEYSRQRLKRCRWGEGKPTCAKCPVHCYKPAMRERIRAVMRYSGPRMMLRHPIMAVRHGLDGRRKVSKKGKKR